MVLYIKIDMYFIVNMNHYNEINDMRTFNICITKHDILHQQYVWH